MNSGTDATQVVVLQSCIDIEYRALPLPCTNYYRNSFSYNGATLWNSLPCDIRNIESLGVFKCKINDIL